MGRSLKKKLDGHLVILTSRSDNIENSSRFFRKTISSIENFLDRLNDGDPKFCLSGNLFTIMVQAFGKEVRLFSISPFLLRRIARLVGKEDMIDRLCGDLRLDIGHTKNIVDWMPVVSVANGVKI